MTKRQWYGYAKTSREIKFRKKRYRSLYPRSRTMLAPSYWRRSDYTLISQSDQPEFREEISCSPIIRSDFASPNAWSYDIFRYTGISGSRREWYPSPYNLYAFSEGTNYGAPPVLPGWERDLLYNQALDKLNSLVRGDLDLGVDLAESGQTLRMTKALSNVTGYLDDYKPSKLTHKLANGWLEWTYGWKPLINDIYLAADESLRIVDHSLRKLRVTSGSEDVLRDEYTAPNWAYETPTLKRRGVLKKTCAIELYLKRPETFNDAAYWSSLNPLSLAWELLPYSFVVDWFYDIGSYLHAAETALLFNTQFQSGFVSELYHTHFTEKPKLGYLRYGGGSYFTVDPDMKRDVYKTSFFRQVLTSYPFPRQPTFRVDLSAARMFSAASLIAQRLHIPCRSIPPSFLRLTPQERMLVKQNLALTGLTKHM